MRNITLSLSDLHRHGSAFFDYLALRKRFFVDTLGWSIPHDDQVEMDQYDNPTARYSLVLDEDGTVLSGARALPTTARWGETSYMLRDAEMGRIGGIPSDLLQGESLTAGMWECTRLVIAPEVTTMADRIACLGLICDGLVDMALEEGATELVSLSNLWLLRALKRLGYDADLMTAPYVNSEDGHKYAVMKMSARHPEVEAGRKIAAGPAEQLRPVLVHSAPRS